jgi:hypothetical protein
MCTKFSELAHCLAVMHGHNTHITRLMAEMATCVESRAGKRLAVDLSNAALQVSINAKELDAEACTIRQIADDLPD